MGYHYDEYEAYVGMSSPYVTYGPFVILTFAMTCLIGLLIIFSLSCALGYIADLAEEFPTATKRILHILIISVLVAHVCLLFERFSFWRSALSFVANILYLRLLRSFPRLQPMSPLTIVTLVATLLETVSWYTLFVFTPRFSGEVGTMKIISFFCFLWMVPVGLVASLELQPVQLPTSGLSMPGRHDHDIAPGARRKTLLKEIKSWFVVPTDY